MLKKSKKNSDWLETLYSLAEKTNATGIASRTETLKTYPFKNSGGRSHWYIPELGALVLGGYTTTPVQTNFIPGTACLLRLKDIKELPYVFDERFFMYHEDVDLSVRLASNKKLLLFSPESVVWHDDHVAPWVAYYVIRNFHWLIFKNFGLRFYLKSLYYSLKTARAVKGVINPASKLIIVKSLSEAVVKLYQFTNEQLPKQHAKFYNEIIPKELICSVKESFANGTYTGFIFHG